MHLPLPHFPSLLLHFSIILGSKSLPESSQSPPPSSSPTVGCSSPSNSSSSPSTCSDFLPVSDTILAAQSLAAYCQPLGPVTEYTKLSWVSNHSRAYICNYNWWHWVSCGYDEIFAAWVAIQETCGLASAGWRFYPERDGPRAGGKTIGFDHDDREWCSNL